VKAEVIVSVTPALAWFPSRVGSKRKKFSRCVFVAVFGNQRFASPESNP
jgi:hypothetical protein